MDNRIVNFPFFQTHHHLRHQNTDQNSNLQVDSIAENSWVFQPPPTRKIESFFSTTKRDSTGIDFKDDIGGSTVVGLMSCTESLCFESSDERRVDDLIENIDEMEIFCLKKPSNFVSRSKKEKAKNFPPPLSSLSQDGKPMSFLKPLRIDGILKLREVRISPPPEILRASRQDGRLRLHLIQDYDENEDDEDVNHVVNMPLEAIDEVIDDDERQEKRVESQILSPSGDGYGFGKRCYDRRGKPSPPPLHHLHQHQHQHQHQHDLHVWRQQLMC